MTSANRTMSTNSFFVQKKLTVIKPSITELTRVGHITLYKLLNICNTMLYVLDSYVILRLAVMCRGIAIILGDMNYVSFMFTF